MEIIMKNLTRAQVIELIEEMQEVALSPDGRRIIAEALNKAEEMKDQLDEVRLIDPSTLHEPFTI